MEFNYNLGKKAKGYDISNMLKSSVEEISAKIAGKNFKQKPRSLKYTEICDYKQIDGIKINIEEKNSKNQTTTNIETVINTLEYYDKISFKVIADNSKDNVKSELISTYLAETISQIINNPNYKSLYI